MNGEMADLFDPYDDRDEDWPSVGRVCKICGKENLSWEEFDGKWFLVEPRTCLIHHCKTLPVDKFFDSKL